MDRLDQLGVVLVAAVGNEGLDVPRYPAAYPSVIGVGAVDSKGRVYPRGNRGPAVEVLAPGVEIVSTVPGDTFAFGDGTSLAAANVTGVLALAIAASGDPLAARTAFFQAAQQDSATLPIRMPSICAVLKRLGKPCATP
jgi:subtilisin family serine protease